MADNTHGLPIGSVLNLGAGVATQILPLKSALAYNTSTTTITTTTQAQYQFKKRGFYPTTGQFEYWVSTDEFSNPPSGNTLIDVTVLQKNLISS